MRGILFYTIAFVLASFSTAYIDHETCTLNRELENQCRSYTYSVVKPFLDFVGKIKDDVEKSDLKDKEINELRKQLGYQQIYTDSIRQLTSQIDLLQSTINKLTTEKQNELIDKNTRLGVCENELKQYKSSLIENDEQIRELKVNVMNNNSQNSTEFESDRYKYFKLGQTAVYKFNRIVENYTPIECLSLKKHPEMSSIKDLGKNPLDASCDASSVGWIVMQKRIYKERFPKTLDSFRSGFGTLYGEMFLGLERIHLITRSQGYLLYGYIEYLDGQFRHFFNEDFQIGDEHDDYDLSALGLFSGNLSIDSLGFSKFNKITLLNRKTSNWFDEGCSNILDAGWWFIYCLPELYLTLLDKNNNWGPFANIKEVQTYIRPKSTYI